MTEQEYIILSNKVKIDSAIKILNDIQIGEKSQYGVNSEFLSDALNNLDNIQNTLQGIIKIS